MRPYILAESHWKTVKDTLYEVAILPWGATEAHNYHLPYGTDVVEATALAEGAAHVAFDRGAKVIVLPTIPFGVNTGQFDVKLDINLNPSTQMAILNDIIYTLENQGIHKMIIVNSHGGNDFRQMLRELGLKYKNMFLSTVDWYKIKEISQFFVEPGDHAGEAETSMMMHLVPETVLPLSQAGGGVSKKFIFKGIQEGWAWAERHWLSISQDTGVGNPKYATPEKGKAFLDFLYEKIGNYIYEVAMTDKKDFYA